MYEYIKAVGSQVADSNPQAIVVVRLIIGTRGDTDNNPRTICFSVGPSDHQPRVWLQETATHSTALHFLSALALLIVVVVDATIAIDSTQFCDAKLCANTRDANGRPCEHVACLKRSSPLDAGGSCPANARFVPLTPALRKQILDRHNQLRCKLANGQLSNFKRCSDMEELVRTNITTTFVLWRSQFACFTDLER